MVGPCGHYACLVCLGEMVAAHPEGKLFCMNCRQEATLPAGGVEALTTNYVMHNILDIIKLSRDGKSMLSGGAAGVSVASAGGKAKGGGSASASATVFDGLLPTSSHLFCGYNCELQDEKPASYGCLDCKNDECPHGVPLCDDCHTAHLSAGKMTRSHKVVSVAEFEATLTAQAVPKCGPHGNKFELYCEHCRCNICMTCYALDHKDHDIRSIPEAAASRRQSVGASIGALHEFVGRVQEERNQARDAGLINDARTVATKAAFRAASASLVEGIRIRTEAACDEVDRFGGSSAKRLHAQEEALELLLANGQSCCDVMERILRESSDTQMLQAATSISTQVCRFCFAYYTPSLHLV